MALQAARKILAEGQARHVVICGVDSYLTATAVAHYLAHDRLLVPGNANGFIPGEAAAAVVCGLTGDGLRLGGLGLAREEAFLYNARDEGGAHLPLRADGMTRAYAQALDEAGVRLSQAGLVMGDFSGEKFAMLRLQRERSEVHPIWAIGASLGNIGATVVPLMLGWTLHATRRRYAPPGPVMIEASADDGACGAAVAVAA